MQSEAWLMIGGIAAGAVVAIAWLNRDVFYSPAKRSGASSSPNPGAIASAPRAEADLPNAAAAKIPAGHLPIQEYEDLLAAAGAGALVREVQEKFAFTTENFQHDVMPVLQQLAEFVQLLPASESHHHAQPGGLLIHLLEVARNALHFREALKLPQGASPEEQMRLGPRWTYGVFIAAVLHDIGKPIADVRVTVYGKDGRDSRPWNGLTGSMLDMPAMTYTVRFPDKREYALHQKLPVILLRSMVPVKTLQWLSDDPQLLQLLMAYLSGENKSNILADIASRADRESVGKNLLHGPRTRFASAQAVPVIERLMAALRRMLEEGSHLPLNRPGAAGFIHGDCAYFVAGTVADRVREYLAKNEVRRDGAAGLPDDNSKLFDVWQDYGAVISNTKGGAMWKIAVELGEWRETFTVLRFPLAKLYRHPDAYPGACAGTITILSDSDSRTSERGAPATAPAPIPAQEQPARPAETQPAFAPPDDGGFEQCLPRREVATAAADPVPVPPPAPEQEAVCATPPNSSTARNAEYLDEDESAAAAFQPKTLPASMPGAPMAPAPKRRPRDTPGAKRQPSPAAERFMAWIQSGLADGSLIYNDSSAMIHFVEEGMLLVSPRIIQEFVKRYGPSGDGIGAGQTDEKAWMKLQHEFQRSGYPARNTERKGSYLFLYSTTNSRSERQVNCYLIPEPERFVNPLPAPNPHLVSKTGNRAGGDPAAECEVRT